jgi:hypothetical protein
MRLTVPGRIAKAHSLAVFRRCDMAKNKTPGDSRRAGAVKKRSQVKNAITGTWTKRDDITGKFMDVKADAKPFRGVRKEKRR